jgi:TrmH family RNA methyltransferase
MKTITSPRNPRFRQAMRLHQSRGRRRQQRFIIFGAVEIRMAIQAGVEIAELFVCPQLLSSAATVLHESNMISADSYELPQSLFEKLAFGERGDGLVAVANRTDSHLEQFTPRDDSLVLVIEAVEKPGNIGAVFRSAEAAGVDTIFLANPICDVFHPNAIRSSLGAVFLINSFSSGSDTILELLQVHGFSVFATRVDATQSYLMSDLKGKTAIVLGNETSGLSATWTGDGVQSIAIPMSGQIDSLNIAMTATLMVFEARRQRSGPPESPSNLTDESTSCNKSRD